NGPGYTTVPDVANKTQAKAIKLLKKHQLFANIQQEHSSTVPSGIVIRTDPTALSQVLVGSRVDLFVSNGPQLVTVPNVVGQQKPVRRLEAEEGLGGDDLGGPDLHLERRRGHGRRRKRAAALQARMRVAVLGGGRSSEHEVSLASAAAVREGLASAGHEPLEV